MKTLLREIVLLSVAALASWYVFLMPRGPVVSIPPREQPLEVAVVPRLVSPPPPASTAEPTSAPEHQPAPVEPVPAPVGDLPEEDLPEEDPEQEPEVVETEEELGSPDGEGDESVANDSETVAPRQEPGPVEPVVDEVAPEPEPLPESTDAAPTSSEVASAPETPAFDAAEENRRSNERRCAARGRAHRTVGRVACGLRHDVAWPLPRNSSPSRASSANKSC